MTVFEAYITNLGKYAEGQLVGCLLYTSWIEKSDKCSASA